MCHNFNTFRSQLTRCIFSCHFYTLSILSLLSKGRYQLLPVVNRWDRADNQQRVFYLLNMGYGQISPIHLGLGRIIMFHLLNDSGGFHPHNSEQQCSTVYTKESERKKIDFLWLGDLKLWEQSKLWVYRFPTCSSKRLKYKPLLIVLYMAERAMTLESSWTHGLKALMAVNLHAGARLQKHLTTASVQRRATSSTKQNTQNQG